MNTLNWEPEMEIIRFNMVDVISTSDVEDEDEMPQWILP